MAVPAETCYRHPEEPTRVHCTRCGRPICPACMTPAPVGHHCPTCVAEGRRSMRLVRPRLRAPRSLTTLILGINVGVFAVDLLLGATGGGSLLAAGAMVPILIAQGEWWRLLTAMFLHIGVLHLAFNSLALYVFGGLVEEALGRLRYGLVYVLTGFAASALSFSLTAPLAAAAGASGAIFGMLGVWLAYNLRRRSLSLARANVQGALVLVGINLVFGLTVPGVDNVAHVGGLVAGVMAGFAAEGWGRGRARAVTSALGLAAVGIAAIALAAWRASSLAG